MGEPRPVEQLPKGVKAEDFSALGHEVTKQFPQPEGKATKLPERKAQQIPEGVDVGAFLAGRGKKK